MDSNQSLLLIDKPAGITSFGVVARVRRILGIKKVGHAGTLDPLATGLMLVGLGSGTKALATLVKLDKVYIADILIGQKRSTGDMEGDIVATKAVKELFADVAILEALGTLLGPLTLPVSAYSAIKIDGVPMYKRARAASARGEVASAVPARAMHVYAADLLSSRQIFLDETMYQVVTVRFYVASGTYIRSLAEAFGERIGYPATLYWLRRTEVGPYTISDATTLEALATKAGTVLF